MGSLQRSKLGIGTCFAGHFLNVFQVGLPQHHGMDLRRTVKILHKSSDGAIFNAQFLKTRIAAIAHNDCSSVQVCTTHLKTFQVRHQVQEISTNFWDVPHRKPSQLRHSPSNVAQDLFVLHVLRVNDQLFNQRLHSKEPDHGMPNKFRTNVNRNAPQPQHGQITQNVHCPRLIQFEPLQCPVQSSHRPHQPTNVQRTFNRSNPQPFQPRKNLPQNVQQINQLALAIVAYVLQRNLFHPVQPEVELRAFQQPRSAQVQTSQSR
uniref:(northern house mosquito) hypothetical protein n=1 Tax=Culex pipiens TaxID=7175 RepID=A0A8D8ABD3_CULPI